MSLRSRDDAGELAFSPIENEPPLRLYRMLHLVPARGLGVGRRAIFYALLAWLPIMMWAAATGHLWTGPSGEHLLQHYGVHVRCLIAIPLLILGEAQLHQTFLRLVPQLRDGGLVAPAMEDAFERLIARVRRLRDVALPWIFLIGAAVAWTIADDWKGHTDEMSWAVDSGGGLGFGGVWFAYVARPIFLALLLGWLWRLVLVTYLFFRLGKLNLSLVPTHPDRAGGLGFVEMLPAGFSLVTLALSAVFASQWAHQILHHGVTFESLKLPIAALVVGWACVLLLPLLAFAPLLAATKRSALASYSSLIAQQGRLVHRRWILREQVEDTPLLDAPEIGPVADASVLYDAVRSMRPVPIGKRAILAIALPLAVPLLVMAALQVPLGEMLGKLVKVLI
jgi:hypothetical protein